ncbi:RNA-guided endonuclease InsQ/TnpB family protein, partial [Streptomyces chartreusis]|uniref:RNA-guided endonuclease InsQ/TnpB family protein n=1 Tax=Streptomyces chartreusis TaxID=1969 RepID=UPI0036A96BA0
MTADATTEASGYCRYIYRLRLSSAARAALEVEWDRVRWVWNECVAKSRAVHAHNRATGERATCGPVQLAAMLTEARARTVWLREGACVPQQQVIRDFGRSRAKALKDIKAGLPMRQRAGMPRWKKKREALPTLEYTRRGFRLKDGRLHVAGGIVVRPVWSRERTMPTSAPPHPDTHAHSTAASATVPAVTEQLPATGRVIGIDWGVKETATTTFDDHDLPHPQHGRTAAQKLARYQRMMARRRPAKGQAASKGYREAKRQTARLHRKVAAQRADTSRKWAKCLVRDHDAIAVEDFRPKFLAKTTMARNAADAAISATKKALV